MTSNFIDQFGFNDEKFADQDDIGKWVCFFHDCLIHPDLCETLCDPLRFLELKSLGRTSLPAQASF